MKKILVSFSLLLFLASCEKVFEKSIDYEIPREPSKITIDSKINAGDSILAMLSTSVYSMGDKQSVLDANFTVNLYKNGDFLEQMKPLMRTGYPGYYRANHRAEPGNIYKIEASRPNYETAFGENLVKEPVEITAGQLIMENQKVELSVSFKEPPGQGDYYFFYVTVDIDTLQTMLRFRTLDPVVEVFDGNPLNGAEATTGKKGFLSDQYFDGKTKSLTLYQEEELGDFTIPDDLSVTFHLFRISREYYLHEQSKATQKQGDGIFIEPVQIYTNIVNGYGIVAGSASSQFSVAL